MESKLFIEQQEELNIEELMSIKGGDQESSDICTAKGSGCMVANSGVINPPSKGTES